MPKVICKLYHYDNIILQIYFTVHCFSQLTTVFHDKMSRHTNNIDLDSHIQKLMKLCFSFFCVSHVILNICIVHSVLGPVHVEVGDPGEVRYLTYPW